MELKTVSCMNNCVIYLLKQIFIETLIKHEDVTLNW